MLTLRFLTRVFALAIAGIGLLQLIFQQVLVGRPTPFVTNTTLASAVAFFSAVALIVCAAQLWVGKTTHWLFLVITVFIFGFSGLSNFYVVATTLDYGAALTCLGKAITIASALWLFYRLSASSETVAANVSSRVYTGLFLTISGVQHFLFADFVKFLIPRWIPFEVFWTYAAGVALVVVGLSLILHLKIKWIAYAGGWMIFLWFLILHIPRGVAEPTANELTAVCESLAVSAILLTLSRIEDLNVR